VLGGGGRRVSLRCQAGGLADGRAPTIAGLTVWHLGQLGPRIALLHDGVGTALSLALIEVVFFDYCGVPFASAHRPVDHLQSAGFAIAVATLVLAAIVARLERSLFDSGSGYSVLVATFLCLAAALRAFDVSRRRADARDPYPPGVDFGAAAVQATQRFDLMR
jgi:hypothetical protein